MAASNPVLHLPIARDPRPAATMADTQAQLADSSRAAPAVPPG